MLYATPVLIPIPPSFPASEKVKLSSQSDPSEQPTPRAIDAKMPAIRAAAYSGVPVYEIQCRGVPVMRRKADTWINATQILRAAGLPKPQRTKVLERDVVSGVHEKVQGGFAGFQGTWIPLDSARLLAASYNIEEDLAVLFDFEPERDGEPLPAKKRSRTAFGTPTPKLEKASEDSSDIDIQDEGTPAPASPRPQRSTVLRAPSTRLRRKPLYVDDFELEDDEPPSKRRASNNAMASRSNSVSRASTPSKITSPQQYPTPMYSPILREKTPPHAGKQCESCGITNTPQWRRGPSGKRTLCNACGVKWSFGRLNPKSGSSSRDGDMTDSDSSTTNGGRYPSAGEEDDPTNSSNNNGGGNELHREIKQLRKKLRDSERTRKHLRGLLEKAQQEDSAMDKKYRRVIAKCRLRPALGTYDDSADSDSDVSDTDEELEAVSIRRFLDKVKRGGSSGVEEDARVSRRMHF
ncbi:hypothetical protein HDV00_006034 [Rhizophlyctis rosea]|nr:hypothetical protein HDV00_006034 [Rhizophlyctis rosea]